MRRAGGYALAIAAAAGLHWAAFALGAAPRSGGAEGAGAGGAELVTLAASSAQMAALVAQWERPPEAVATAPEMAPPPALAPPMPQKPGQDQASVAPLAVVPPAVPALAMPAPDVRPAVSPPAPPKTPPKPKPAPTPPGPKPPKPKPAPKPAATPAPEAAKSAAAQAAQRAKGQGGAEAAGHGGKAGAASASKAAVAKAQAVWGARIRARIERQKRAPAGAADGRVIVRLQVAASGALQAVAVVRSAGVAALDDAATRAVRRAAPFAPAPPELGPGPFTLELPVQFTR